MNIDSTILASIATAFDHHASRTTAFRRIARCDAFPFFVATRHPRFNANLLWSAPPDLAGMVMHVDKMLREDRSFEKMFFAVVTRETGEWVGQTLIRPFRDGVEFGLLMHPDRWGRHTVSMVAAPAIEIVRRAVPDIPVYARTLAVNTRVAATLRLIGFETIDASRETHAVTGEMLDVAIHHLCGVWRSPRLEAY